jgi:hypothetical protein
VGRCMWKVGSVSSAYAIDCSCRAAELHTPLLESRITTRSRVHTNSGGVSNKQ